MKFYLEEKPLAYNTQNFRPYYASENMLQVNIHLFSNPLANLMTSADFRSENTLTRILRMANLDIEDIANDHSVIF